MIRQKNVRSFNLVEVIQDVLRLRSAAEYEPYLSVRVSGGELSIGLKNLPDRITRRIKGGEVVATIAMPALYSLEMSGATKLYCEDFFDTGNRPFKMELSGAARVTRIDLSGSATSL